MIISQNISKYFFNTKAKIKVTVSVYLYKQYCILQLSVNQFVCSDCTHD